jgi:mycothiol system anti-sigma-R factor
MADLSDCGPECLEALSEIEAYLDGEVEVSTRVQIEQHLGGCNPCMDKAEFRRHVKELVHERCAERSAPPELTARIEALIRSHEGPFGA